MFPLANLPPHIPERLTVPPRREPSRPEHHGHRPIDPSGAKWLADALAQTRDGTGDSTGYWLAQQLLCNGADDPEGVLMTYANAATVNAEDPFDERSVRRWLESAGRAARLSAVPSQRAHGPA
jgi:hypothetical protein